jgi:hypothetical protein
MAIVDTTFLIDLMKESKTRRRGKATAKLEELVDRGESLRLAVFSIGELYVGVGRERSRTRNAQPSRRASICLMSWVSRNPQLTSSAA